MKKIIFSAFLTTLFIWACKQQKTQPAVELPPVVEGGLLTQIDTARLTLIDSMVYTIDTTANKSGTEITLEPNLYSEKDNIRYFKKDGALWRTVAVYHIPEKNMETRSVFYWKDGKPQFVRHREWHKFPAPRPMSKEVITFFEDGKVVAIVERSTLLQPNEPPSKLYPVPLEITTRTLKEVVEEYTQYRDPALKAIEEFEKNGAQEADTLK